MKVALAQMNSHLGEFKKNHEKVVELCQEAADKEVNLLVFPELTLLGYHPFDLMERPGVITRQNETLESLLKCLPPELPILLGVVTENSQRGKPYYNSAVLIHQGKVEKVFHKELLPVYDVFDDSRHFAPGSMSDNSFELMGHKIQVLICEDMWGWDELHSHNPILDLPKNTFDLVVNLSASPFTLGKREKRVEHAKRTVETLGAPLVYVNMVGAQDELIYDGGSFALDKQGKKIAQNAYFIEDLNVVDLETRTGGMRQTPEKDIEHLHQALVLGIRDFVNKIGFSKVHLGLSGGIDSAIVACLLVDALGPQKVTTIAMPTQFNSPLSLSLAKDLASNLKCAFYEIPIQETFDLMLKTYESCFGKKEFSTLHENLQSRIRGDYLMGYSNEHGSLLVTTGNKSEYATGYATLYGDMCGGLAPIGDLLKKQVFALAQYYNKDRELIPKEIIERPPSAELRPNQKDSDSLPDYDILDTSVQKLVSRMGRVESETDEWVLKKLYLSEFKRWQAAPILKVSDHAFGRGRRMPIAHGAWY